jgi:hypothetical protein
VGTLPRIKNENSACPHSITLIDQRKRERQRERERERKREREREKEGGRKIERKQKVWACSKRSLFSQSACVIIILIIN